MKLVFQKGCLYCLFNYPYWLYKHDLLFWLIIINTIIVFIYLFYFYIILFIYFICLIFIYFLLLFFKDWYFLFYCPKSITVLIFCKENQGDIKNMISLCYRFMCFLSKNKVTILHINKIIVVCSYYLGSVCHSKCGGRVVSSLWIGLVEFIVIGLL